MNYDSFTSICDLQEKILNLTSDNYDEILKEIINLEGFHSNKLFMIQIINSIKSIFKINDEKSELCMKLLLDLFPYLINDFSKETILHFFPFREYKFIILNLMKANIIPQDFIQSKYSKGSIEYDYYLSSKDEDLKLKGMNNNELSLIIRSDNIMEFQDLYAKSDFNLNSIIPPSSFEKFNSINLRPTLIEYASFFGSIRIFKFLWLKKVQIPPNLAKFAVAGGNYEIIHIIEDANISFDGCLEVAIGYFRTEIIEYLIENQNFEFTTSTLIYSIVNYNVKYFLKIIKTIQNINELGSYGFGNMISPLHAAAENGLIDIVKFLCSFKDIDLNVKIPNLLVTPLHMAAGNGHIDVVKFLCGLNKININCEQCVFINFYIEFQFFFFFFWCFKFFFVIYYTPLKMAIMSEEKETIAYLRSIGARLSFYY